MKKRHTSVGNRLLAALPPADLGLLVPHLQQISLRQDAVLVRSGDRNEQIYFPHSGTISFMLDMPNGQTVATSVIGHEGAVGMLSVLGPSRSPTTAVVRVAGIASQISASRFHAAFGQSSAIKHAVQTHTRALLMQFQHVAACNALHPVEARMARWLNLVQGDLAQLDLESQGGSRGQICRRWQRLFSCCLDISEGSNHYSWQLVGAEIRWSDASRPRHAQVADRRSPVNSLLTNAA
jgi:CRP-like cAMP-binding protein